MTSLLDGRALVVVRAGLLTIAGIVFIALAGNIPVAATSSAMLAIALAIFVLELFDLWLPQGDSVGVDGALAACAIVIAGPVTALIGCACARVLAHAMRHRLRRCGDALLSLERRFVGLAAAVALMQFSISSARVVGLELSPLLLAAIACASLLLTELLVSQLQAAGSGRRSVLHLLGANLQFQAPLLASQVSVAVLAIITHAQMGAWSLVLMTTLLLLTRQAYSMLLEVRQAYRATIEALVDAAESQSSTRAGHAERTADIARKIATRVRVSSRVMEHISYAALLHDLDMIGVDAEESLAGPATRQSGTLLAEVGFLSGVVPILRLCDGDAIGTVECTDEQRMASMIVALASDADHFDNPSADSGGAVERVSPLVPSEIKGRAIGAAVSLGYSVPALR